MRFGFDSEKAVEVKPGSDYIGVTSMAYQGYPFVFVNVSLKLAVWTKGHVVAGYDPAVYRQDACGNWMEYSRHGEEGEYGWEIDHVYPRSMGGPTVIDNLQPLWWRNNRRKGDSYPWFC